MWTCISSEGVYAPPFAPESHGGSPLALRTEQAASDLFLGWLSTQTKAERTRNRLKYRFLEVGGRDPMSPAEYLAHGGSACPVCGSYRIEASLAEHFGGEVFQEVLCLHCEATWDDHYHLVGFGNVDVSP